MGYFYVKKTIKAKQQEREDRMAALPEYNTPLTTKERDILKQEAEQVVSQVQSGELKAPDVLKAYGKMTFKAQRHCNPVTEIMIKDAEKWAANTNTEGSLAGFPISLKDTAGVTGYDSCMGYTGKCFKPFTKDAPIIRLLKDCGAVPFVKTNVPYTLLSFESYNDVWGRTDNPHVPGHSAGGSTGGESALLAYGGSRLGIGTDVAGSVRLPSHFCGIYTVKCSTGRFPKAGNNTTMPGQEGIPAVYSPMTRTLADLKFFLKAVVDQKPWNYDYSCHPIPWTEASLPKKIKFGVMYTDGIVDPSPACARALKMTVDALEAQGHETVEWKAPDTLDCLRIASQLLVSDAGAISTRDQIWPEKNDVGVARMFFACNLPRWMKKIWAWYLEHVKGDKVWAALVRDFNKKTITERWDLVYEREGYKNKFFEQWQESGIDFLLTVPNATPAFPHNGLYESISSCGYTFMFNLLDYSAGVLPVTKVDREQDKLPAVFNLRKLNAVARGAYSQYNAEKMHGLPVGVQVIAPRLKEEDCIAAMEVVEGALQAKGIKYPLLNE